MIRILLAAFIGLISAAQCLAQQSTSSATGTPTYQNPVIAGDFADPSIIRVGNTYYAVGTSSEWGPAFPIYSSNDLINWTYLGPVFTKLPSWTMGSYWAPELVYRRGTFYVYYTARRKSDGHSYIGVATTQDLRKGFSDHGLLLAWTAEAIDAFIVENEEGLYITWKAYGLDKGRAIEILGASLSDDGLHITGKAFTLLTADRAGWENGGTEGQAIVKRGRYYYMTYSGNTCCGPQCNYQVGLARAEKLQGPWEKFAGNPVLVGSDSWKCPGHGTVVTTPDNRFFYLHHAYDGTDFTFTGRQGVLSELVWNEETQWPAFRYGTTTPAQAESPLGGIQNKELNQTINFGNGAATTPWVWDVSLPAPNYTIRQGQLQLTPTAAGPAGSFLGMVVKKGTYTFSAELDPQRNLRQSVCVYGDAHNALGFGIRDDSLQLWQVKEGVYSVLNKQVLSSEQRRSVVKLQIHSRAGRFYTFGWSTNGGAAQRLSETPVDGSFLPRWDGRPVLALVFQGFPTQAAASGLSRCKLTSVTQKIRSWAQA